MKPGYGAGQVLFDFSAILPLENVFLLWVAMVWEKRQLSRYYGSITAAIAGQIQPFGDDRSMESFDMPVLASVWFQKAVRFSQIYLLAKISTFFRPAVTMIRNMNGHSIVSLSCSAT